MKKLILITLIFVSILPGIAFAKLAAPTMGSGISTKAGLPQCVNGFATTTQTIVSSGMIANLTWASIFTKQTKTACHTTKVFGLLSYWH